MTVCHPRGGPPSVAITRDIAASPDLVWTALTDPCELAAWFAPEADVQPGPGGRVRFSWGRGVTAESQITAWTPQRHLHLVEINPFGGRVGGRRPQIDFRLVSLSDGAATRLCLVHSGLDSPAAAAFRESIRRGWEFELLSLSHYLGGHRGTPRVVAHVQRDVAPPADAAWLFIVRAMQFERRVDAGEDYSVRPTGAGLMRATVEIWDPPHQLAMSIASMQGALFRVKLANIDDVRTEATAWLATYGAADKDIRSFQIHWRRVLDRLAEEGAGTGMGADVAPGAQRM